MVAFDDVSKAINQILQDNWYTLVISTNQNLRSKTREMKESWASILCFLAILALALMLTWIKLVVSYSSVI